MGISKYHSTVVLSRQNKPYPTILEYLSAKFPNIARSIWEKRIMDNKITDASKKPITLNTEYKPYKKLHYFREVQEETKIPFNEEILFQNNDILIACKPHFLPVTPAGSFVNECLLNRLKEKTQNSDIVPVHRIDRETAGIVMFSTNKKTRGIYTELFRKAEVKKTYLAIGCINGKPLNNKWIVRNRIVRDEKCPVMKIVGGLPNSHSKIKLLKLNGNTGIFLLKPYSGKTHQLRLHMSSLGYPIVNDRFYPDLLPCNHYDFTSPLQLIAKTLKFHDPITNKQLCFISRRKLIDVN